MATCYVDLVLDNDQLVRVECPSSQEDELYDQLEAAMKQRTWWAPGAIYGCSARCNGLRLGRVAMSRVVGML